MLLVIVFLAHSCRKAALQNQQELNAQAAAVFPVNEAKDWFSGNKAALATKVTLNSTDNFLSAISDFTPVWDSARTAVDTNYYVVEAPAKYLKRIVFATDSTGANANGITRLLVLKGKKTGSVSAVLMQVHSDAGTDINSVHYMDLPANFSGNIFYTTIQGAFMGGYIYKNGKITKRSVNGGNTAKPAGPQILQAYVGDDGCQNVDMGWFLYTCYYTGNDELIGCDKQLLFTTTYTYCSDPNNDPNHGGGGAPPPPDCPAGTHPADGSSGDGSGGNGGVDVASVKGKLVVNFTYVAASNCVPDTVKKNKIIKNFCDNLTDTQKSAINASVDSLSRYDCTSKFLYNYLANTLGLQYSFCIGTDPTPNYSMNYNPGTKGFTYATDEMTDLAVISSLEHEFFHALQDALVGTSGYGKNLTTGIAKPGFVDIEFEQAVFHDIQSGYFSAFDNGTAEQQRLYTIWIKSLTNNGTTYPRIDNTDTGAYAEFINQYGSFLSQFNDLPGNVYHSDILNLTPTSLIFIFNHTDPNC